MKLASFVSEYSYSGMRVVSGFAFASHGVQKVFGGFGADQPAELMSLLGFAGIVELVGGTLISLGLYTTFSAFLASGQMAVAYFMAHQPQGFLPIVNGGELAVLYCFLFLYIASRGSGAVSLDRLLRGLR